MWGSLKWEFLAFLGLGLGFRAKYAFQGGRPPNHTEIPNREIAIFAKSRYLENHMGKAPFLPNVLCPSLTAMADFLFSKHQRQHTTLLL